MRILMLAHRMPYPPTTGDKVRAYHIARHLRRSHELTLAFLVDDHQPAAALAALRSEIPDISHATITRRFRQISSLLRLLGGGSATIAYFDSPRLRTRVSNW